MEYLIFAGFALGLVGLFWLVGRLLSSTPPNEGGLHGNSSGGPQTD